MGSKPFPRARNYLKVLKLKKKVKRLKIKIDNLKAEYDRLKREKNNLYHSYIEEIGRVNLELEKARCEVADTGKEELEAETTLKRTSKVVRFFKRFGKDSEKETPGQVV